MPITFNKTRRAALASLGVLALSAALGTGGCSNGPTNVSLTDLTAITVDTLADLLLGPPYSPTRTALVDPPLLKKGDKETVLVAADVAAFVALSKGAIPEKSLNNARKDVVRMVNRRLKDEGFSAVESTVYPPVKPADTKTLVATLVPVLESAGSPQEKATGRGRQLVLIRLSVSDPITGESLRQRDYYSGVDVPRPGDNDPNRRGR
jgi:hypothetical protein